MPFFLVFVRTRIRSSMGGRVQKAGWGVRAAEQVAAWRDVDQRLGGRGQIFSDHVSLSPTVGIKGSLRTWLGWRGVAVVDRYRSGWAAQGSTRRIKQRYKRTTGQATVDSV